jgi:hypothetical protein
LQLYVWGLYKKFPTGAWGKSFAKVRNFDLQKTLGNPKIRFAYFDTGLYIKSLGIPIKGDTLVPLLMYLNELGGRIVLDILEREEIYEMLVNFAINNLDEIKSR